MTDRQVLAEQISTLDNEKSIINKGFDDLIGKYGKNPNFNADDFEALRQQALKGIDDIAKEFGDTGTGLQGKILAGKPAALNTNKLNQIRGAATGAFEDTAGSAAKLKQTTGFAKGKNFLKATGFVRGLVCGGLGGVAGYSGYRSTLTEEVENKITLDAGSGNVLDPTTSNLIFQKGQTYKFTVGPGSGAGKSNTVSIDIVDPQTLVPANAWLDDCSQK